MTYFDYSLKFTDNDDAEAKLISAGIRQEIDGIEGKIISDIQKNKKNN